MKFIIASDSFKGSLSSDEANDTIEKAVNKVFPESKCVKLCIADGGEGTLDAVVGKDCKSQYDKVFVDVTDPLGNIIQGYYLKNGNSAVVEMAVASGITLVDADKRNPLIATSKGTGELIAHALKNGCTDIYIGIGGSATNDGGTGAMTALGFKFIDEAGNVVDGNGENLSKIKLIDNSSALKEIESASFTVMCDVKNTLTGKMGATYVYGPQKGASQSMIDELENGMINYQSVLERYVERDLKEIEGLGAAGGMGAALYTFLNAKLQSGIEVLLELNGFENELIDADVVITGEGKTDYQSACGKVVYGIANKCKQKDIPVLVVSGSLDDDISALYGVGVGGMEASVCKITDIDDAMKNAGKYLFDAAVRILNVLKTGIRIGGRNE